MIATAGPNHNRQVHRRKLVQFRRSIDPWERQGHEVGRNGDTDLAAGYADDVADLGAILRLIETKAVQEAAKAIARWALRATRAIYFPGRGHFSFMATLLPQGRSTCSTTAPRRLLTDVISPRS